MDALALMVAGPPGGQVVVPRRLSLEVVPGDGRLRIDAPPVDVAWRLSVERGWRAALALAGRADVDARLVVASGVPLQGGSSGLAVGLCALAQLCGDGKEPERHFSTGAVLDDGSLEGGSAVAVKGAAAAQLGPQVGAPDPLFLCPPLPEPPRVDGVRLAMASDLGSAFARLSPGAYAGIARRHAGLRRVPDGEESELHEPFALARACAPMGLPDRAGGVRVHERIDPRMPPGLVALDLGEGGVAYWRAHASADAALADLIPRLWGMGRAASALAR